MEKKLFVMAAAIMMATASANAQEEQVVDAYFTADEMPDMRLFMPGPPDRNVLIRPSVMPSMVWLPSWRSLKRLSA